MLRGIRYVSAGKAALGSSGNEREFDLVREGSDLVSGGAGGKEAFLSMQRKRKAAAEFDREFVKKFALASKGNIQAEDVFDGINRDAVDDKLDTKQKNFLEHAENSLLKWKPATESCIFCMSANGNVQQRRQISDEKIQNQELVIATGLNFYLALPFPNSGPVILTGECRIIPKEHFVSGIEFPSSEYFDEIDVFKRRICQLFLSQGKGTIFMESSIVRNTPGRHFMIECYPLPLGRMDDAKMFFNRSLSESDSEWATHQKIIQTHMTEKPLRKCIPKEFSYFHVQFNLGQGYAHVIEDSKVFDWKFGKEVLCAILDEPAQFLLRKKPPPSKESLLKQASEFKSSWEPYDWTKSLD